MFKTSAEFMGPRNRERGPLSCRHVPRLLSMPPEERQYMGKTVEHQEMAGNPKPTNCSIFAGRNLGSRIEWVLTLLSKVTEMPVGGMQYTWALTLTQAESKGPATAGCWHAGM